MARVRVSINISYDDIRDMYYVNLNHGNYLSIITTYNTGLMNAKSIDRVYSLTGDYALYLPRFREGKNNSMQC